MKLLLKNGIVIRGDGQAPASRADICTDGALIASIGEQPVGFVPDRVIDCSRLVLMPGFVNAHTHLPMTAMRGFADDYALHDWLFDHVFPVEDRFDDESVRICALIGIAEAISTGTASVSDMYFFSDAIAQAAAESGIRANIARSITWSAEGEFSRGTCKAFGEAIDLCRSWNGAESGRIKTDLSVHAEYTSVHAVWEAVASEAEKLGVGVQIHLSETKSEHDNAKAKYGLTPAQLFDRAGLLNEKTVAAHCVWLESGDMELLAARGVTAVHCPTSNLKLGSGIAQLSKMLEKGINVAIGTDGPASNNSHDMFAETKLAAILAKGSRQNPTAVPAALALRLATAGGAAAQGRRGQTGELKAGMRADITAFAADALSVFPLHDPVSAAVYAAHGSDVRLTMVDGKVLYENGEFKTIDIERLRYGFEKTVRPKLFS